jgi:1,4-alpha-glucan branching enzyme
MSLRFQPRPFTRQTAFHCRAPHAHQVSLVLRSTKEGTVSTHAMHKAIDGCWHIQLELPRGRYVYRFLVDGHPMLDPASRGSVPDDHGGLSSIREVGH